MSTVDTYALFYEIRIHLPAEQKHNLDTLVNSYKRQIRNAASKVDEAVTDRRTAVLLLLNHYCLVEDIRDMDAHLNVDQLLDVLTRVLQEEAALKEAQKAIDKGVRHKVKQLLKEIKTGLKV